MQNYRKSNSQPDGMFFGFMAVLALVTVCWPVFGPNPYSLFSAVLLAIMLSAWLAIDFPVVFYSFVFIIGVIIAITWNVLIGGLIMFIGYRNMRSL